MKLAIALIVFVAGIVGDPADARPPMRLHDAPLELPSPRFTDEAGDPVALDRWRGKVVLVNVWATWCVPCREEMPTLDALQARLGGADFHVVALSIDRAGVPPIRRFYDEIGIRHLEIHNDASMRAGSALGVVGLPSTILIDRQGRELARLIGPAEWDAPEMVAFLEDVIGTTGNEPGTVGSDGDSIEGRQ